MDACENENMEWTRFEFPKNDMQLCCAAVGARTCAFKYLDLPVDLGRVMDMAIPVMHTVPTHRMLLCVPFPVLYSQP